MERINIYVHRVDFEKILDALREKAQYSDNSDKWIELIGELLAQRTINDRFLKTKNKVFVDEKKTIAVKESKLNKVPVISFRHRTGSRDRDKVITKYVGLRKSELHETFGYAAF
jgi:hypothetical protein